MAFDPVSAVLDIGGKLIDRLWPNKADQDAAKLKMLELQQSGELAILAAETDLAKGQLAVNQAEASNTSVFVSGWRPAVGWVCASGLAYAAIIEPLARFTAKVAFSYVGDFPVIDTTLTMQVLLGMLGLAGMRSFEKSRNVAAK